MQTLAGENILTEQVIIDILLKQMNLDKSQGWARDTNAIIPTDDKLYIVVGLVDAQPIASDNSFLPGTVDVTPDKELQQVIMQEHIQIDIFSRNRDLLARRWEIIPALHSIFAKQKQEELSFKIFRLPKSFVNTSSNEGSSNIIRYSATFVCNVWYRKEKVLQSPYDYFDTFTTRVDDEISIGTPTGIIEFTID
jgi:hypothetical protein